LKTKKDAKKVDLCFNFSKGRRILVYIRKETAVNTSNENEKDTKIIHRSKSPIKPKIIHRSKSPIKPKTAKAKAVVKKSCPEGKVRNPETGRCILIKNAKIAKAKVVVKKSCPEGKVRNPETGRCILIKNAKVAKAKAVVKKSCPEGKVRNPETGRCILIKNAKKAKAKAVVKKSPIKKPNDNNAVELSVFTYISKDSNFRRTAYYNEMIFVKLGNKVYIEISEGDEQNAPVNEMLDILMPFEELMKNQYLKKYYELSRMAIGKPNIDTNYYRENVNIKNNYHLIDTLYIVEDPLTKIKVAKKGNSYRHFNLAKLKKMTVADAYSIEEFNNEYNIRYGVDDKTLDEVVANYTALANQL